MSKIEKLCTFCQKTLKIVILKGWNDATTTRNYAVAYYKTLDKVPWHQGLKNSKNDKIFQKAWKKIMKISIKLRVFSDRLFERSHGGGGGGGGATR